MHTMAIFANHLIESYQLPLYKLHTKSLVKKWNIRRIYNYLIVLLFLLNTICVEKKVIKIFLLSFMYKLCFVFFYFFSFWSFCIKFSDELLSLVFSFLPSTFTFLLPLPSLSLSFFLFALITYHPTFIHSFV